MLFGLGDTSLEWGLGARLLSLAHFTACILFAALVSTMQKDEVLAIAQPKDREFVRFSVGETFDANVKVLQAVVPRPQSTGPRDTYIVRRVCQGPPFARWRRGVREGGALPPTWDPPAVVVGDEEGNIFMGEWYCPQVTINSFWDAGKNTKKREEHSAMFWGWGGGPTRNISFRDF